jgi:hypothetical protein
VRQWGTYYGGNGDDEAASCCTDPSGYVYIGGKTASSNNMGSTGAHQSVFGGGFVLLIDAFLAKFDGCGSAPTQPASINGVASLCAQQGAQTYSVAAVSSATSYSWSLPAGWSASGASNIILVSPGGTGGVLSVSAINACGIGNAQTLTITVNPQPTISVNSGSICAGQSFTLNPTGASTYTFSSGSPVVTPFTTTTYSVSGTSALGCTSSNATTVSVIVNPLPTVAVNGGSICSGQSFTFSPTGAATYTINGGSLIVSPTSSAVYSITGSSALGCPGSNTAVAGVTVNPLPSISTSPSNTFICKGRTLVIKANGASSYTWAPGTVTGSNVSLSPTVTTNYTITGLDNNGCSNTSVVTLSVSSCTGVDDINASVYTAALYPNPFKTAFTIDLETACEVFVLDAIGRQLCYEQFSSGKHRINMEAYTSGIYIVRVINKNTGTVETKKIIKQ